MNKYFYVFLMIISINCDEKNFDKTNAKLTARLIQYELIKLQNNQTLVQMNSIKYLTYAQVAIVAASVIYISQKHNVKTSIEQISWHLGPVLLIHIVYYFYLQSTLIDETPYEDLKN